MYANLYHAIKLSEKSNASATQCLIPLDAFLDLLFDPLLNPLLNPHLDPLLNPLLDPLLNPLWIPFWIALEPPRIEDNYLPIHVQGMYRYTTLELV